MNIAQALKKKNRLQGELTTLIHSYQTSNRTVKGNNDLAEKSSQIFIKINNMITEISKLKGAIAKATHPVAHYISKLGHLKEALKATRELDISTSDHRYKIAGEVDVEYDVSINDVTKQQYIKDLTNQINDIQDELDNFNASTQV